VTATDARRGPYAKGVERRAQILAAALAAYTRASSPTLKAIADSVGLSEAGVLHYFGTKEELFVAILEARDEVTAEQFDISTIKGLWDALAYASQTPGLSKLYADMSVAAANPEHPAHDFMKRRSADLTAAIASLIPGCTATDWRVRTLVAAAEGLQIAWLRDPNVDVVADIQELFVALVPKGRSRRPA
jgi:AcrR family transcriptional regulator